MQELDFKPMWEELGKRESRRYGQMIREREALTSLPEALVQVDKSEFSWKSERPGLLATHMGAQNGSH